MSKYFLIIIPRRKVSGPKGMDIFKALNVHCKPWRIYFFMTSLQISFSKLLTRLNETCPKGRGLLYYQIVPLILRSIALVMFSPLVRFLCYSWQLKNEQNYKVPFLELFLEGFLCPLSIQQHFGVESRL